MFETHRKIVVESKHYGQRCQKGKMKVQLFKPKEQTFRLVSQLNMTESTGKIYTNSYQFV